MTRLAGIVVAFVIALPGWSDTGAAESSRTIEWPAYGGSPGGGHYTRAAQITPDNVSGLSTAWTHRSGDFVPGVTSFAENIGGDGLHSRPSSFVVTPIMVRDSLYYCTPFNRVFALNPATGAQRWVFDPGVDISNEMVSGAYVVDSRRQGAPSGVVRAYNVRTGKFVWGWNPTQPTLAELTIAGVSRPAVVQVTKMGMTFVLDRETGKPLHPMEERRVPQTGAVPGEYLSPTQPFPVLPERLHQLGMTPEDAWGLTFWDEDQCRKKLVPRIDCPANMVFPQQNSPYCVTLNPVTSSLGIPCSAPPWATLAAVDLESGRIKWQIPFGTLEHMVPWPFYHLIDGGIQTQKVRRARGLLGQAARIFFKRHAIASYR